MSNCNSYIKSKLDLNTPNNVNNLNSNKPKCFKVDDLTSLKYDSDYINFDNAQRQGPADYIFTTDNNTDKDGVCNKKNLIETATCSPNINFRDGLGVNACNINLDAKVRYSKVRHERKHQRQLFERPFTTMPYIGRGYHDVDSENFLFSGELTGQHKQCNALAGVFIENQYTPLVPNLRDNIQNNKNLIPEDSKKDWVRGGMSSRNIVKDIDYLSRCKNEDNVKKILIKKKLYLHKDN